MRILPVLTWLAVALGAALTPVAAAAQSAFAPAIRVDDAIITSYELQQRTRFLQALNAPGDVAARARQQLIDDKIQLAAAANFGIRPSEAQIAAGMSEFAGRANLSTEEFSARLRSGGIDPQTFRDFVTAGVAWRDVVRARFGGSVQLSTPEVDRARQAQAREGSLRVLLTEIILAAPPQRLAQAQARARQLAQIRSIPAFTQAARQYSAAPTRAQGGRVPWIPLSQLPPALQPIIQGLQPGEVTQPLSLPNAIALFQLRAIEEGPWTPPAYSEIDYAVFLLPDGPDGAGLREAQRLTGRIDRCDDLYGVAKDLPEERLQRQSVAPGDVPTDIAIELAKLDPGETSAALTRDSGTTRLLVMLCGRTPEATADLADDALRSGLLNSRLERKADAFLAELRANAVIVEQ